MKKVYIIFSLVAVTAVVLSIFNNCSDVGFEKAPGAASGLDSSSTDLGSNGDPSSPNDPSSTGDLTTASQDPPIPVSELDNDPTLYDRYQCDGGNGVTICHFPDNVESQATQCVGRPAVSTHYDHIRTYIMDGVEKTIGDYLGNCRVAL